MTSRFALTIRYGLTILRRPRGSMALTIMGGSHFAAGIIYLGVTFRFTDSTNSRVFVTWYIVSFAEAVLIFTASSMFKSLRFNGAGLSERMKATTLLILGEGVIVVTGNVGTIAQNANSWSVLIRLLSQLLSTY